MGNLARKFIDAVQNSLLDKLVGRLVPLLWVALMWDRLSQPNSGVAGLVLLSGVVGLWLLYSLVGAIADDRPKPRRRSPYDQIHESPPSAFAAWGKQPEGGLRPPAPIRRIVMTLGARGPGWFSIIEAFLFLGSFTVAWLLAYKSQTFWSEVHPGLAEQAAREQLFLAVSAVLLGLLIRGWAVEQRYRLSPSTRPEPPLFSQILFGVVFGAFLGMMLGDLLGYGLLPGAIGGVCLVAIVLLPPWRDRVLDALFGKRDPVDSRP